MAEKLSGLQRLQFTFAYVRSTALEVFAYLSRPEISKLKPHSTAHPKPYTLTPNSHFIAQLKAPFHLIMYVVRCCSDSAELEVPASVVIMKSRALKISGLSLLRLVSREWKNGVQL